MIEPGEDLNYLKQVSRVKHRILQDYLAPWTTIIGSRHHRLGYVDCFAGAGSYRDEVGQVLPGSPLIALGKAKEYAEKHSGHSLKLAFVEKDRSTAQRLKLTLTASLTQVPGSVEYTVEEEDAQDFVERLISLVKESKTGRIIPTFFFVDPYGHPVSIPVMRKLLSLGKTEILVNLIWFRIAMHLENPREELALDRLFGHGQWREQTFRQLQGRDKEKAFVQYFAEELGAQYWLPFAMPFSPEDRVAGGDIRTKFYLIHFSNHPKAALLMKDVMWSARKDLDKILVGPQLRLFEDHPDLKELRLLLVEHFKGRRVSFDDIRIQTLQWPYVATHYGQVLKCMEGEEVRIDRVESKKTGLKGRDWVIFFQRPG